jgi:hypothetical protein
MSIRSRWARLRRRIAGRDPRRVVWTDGGRVEFDRRTGKIIAVEMGSLGMKNWRDARDAFDQAEHRHREWKRSRR